jgi:hypothetical protein
MQERLLKDCSLFDKKNNETVQYIKENPDGTVKVAIVKIDFRDCKPEDLTEADGQPYGKGPSTSRS